MSNSSYSVLIVDADTDFREKIREELYGAGFDVTIVEGGIEAIDAVRTAPPQILIVAIELPDMTGLDVLRTLRGDEDSRVSGVSAIVVSNTGAIEEISEAIKMHISDYLVRQTYHSGDIIAKVRKHMQSGTDMPSPAQGYTSQASVPVHEMSLMIVEDDKFLRDLAVQKLEKEGIKTFAAMDGEQGIAIATKEIPDVVLLDILLPGIDGFEVLTQIKANPQLVNTTVIMLSNFGQREDIDRAKRLGAEQFLIKASFTLDEIIEEVKKVISRKQQSV